MQFSWRIRKRFWDGIAISKFRFNKPAVIPVPEASTRVIKAVPMSSRYPAIPIHNILVADQIPEDEFSRLKQNYYGFQVRMYTTYPPMQKGLPPIDADPQKALEEAYTAAHRKYFPGPVLPPEFEGSPELGFLAVAGPYACYLEKTPEGVYQWDLRNLGSYEHHEGLHSLGVRVLFRVDASTRSLHATQIESELGISKPADPGWEQAKKLALCALSTHASLVRHFAWVHMASGAPLAIATRNCLPHDHPLRRLLWPHMFGTQYSNDLITNGQLAKGGEFETIFSFTHQGLCRLMQDAYSAHTFIVNDPEKDAARRGILGGNFDTPSLDNLRELFDVMHRHARRYVASYYQTDETLGKDEHLKNWLEQLDTLIPNGIRCVLGDKATLDSVSRLIGACIHLVTVVHEVLGTSMWNYQLWVHRQPARVYKGGGREPLDVYQRLVNANFTLNVRRKQLLDDFSYLALDAKGQREFQTFREELLALQSKLEREEPASWRICPRILEANINA